MNPPARSLVFSALVFSALVVLAPLAAVARAPGAPAAPAPAEAVRPEIGAHVRAGIEHLRAGRFQQAPAAVTAAEAVPPTPDKLLRLHPKPAHWRERIGQLQRDPQFDGALVANGIAQATTGRGEAASGLVEQRLEKGGVTRPGLARPRLGWLLAQQGRAEPARQVFGALQDSGGGGALLARLWLIQLDRPAGT